METLNLFFHSYIWCVAVFLFLFFILSTWQKNVCECVWFLIVLNVVGGCASRRYLTSIPTNEHIGKCCKQNEGNLFGHSTHIYQAQTHWLPKWKCHNRFWVFLLAECDSKTIVLTLIKIVDLICQFLTSFQINVNISSEKSLTFLKTKMKIFSGSFPMQRIFCFSAHKK